MRVQIYCSSWFERLVWRFGLVLGTLALPVARGLVFHGSYSYPSRRRGSNLINAIAVEEERAAAQSRASNKDDSSLRLGSGHDPRSKAFGVLA